MKILALLLLLWLLPTLLFTGVAAFAIPGALARRWARRAAIGVAAHDCSGTAHIAGAHELGPR